LGASSAVTCWVERVRSSQGASWLKVPGRELAEGDRGIDRVGALQARRDRDEVRLDLGHLAVELLDLARVAVGVLERGALGRDDQADEVPAVLER